MFPMRLFLLLLIPFLTPIRFSLLIPMRLSSLFLRQFFSLCILFFVKTLFSPIPSLVLIACSFRLPFAFAQVVKLGVYYMR
jgi:hypothetical protein